MNIGFPIELRGVGYHSILVSQAFRQAPQVPDDAQPGKHLKEVIGNIDFPPVKSLARGNRIMVVIVMPPLAQCNQR